MPVRQLFGASYLHEALYKQHPVRLRVAMKDYDLLYVACIRIRAQAEKSLRGALHCLRPGVASPQFHKQGSRYTISHSFWAARL